MPILKNAVNSGSRIICPGIMMPGQEQQQDSGAPLEDQDLEREARGGAEDDDEERATGHGHDASSSRSWSPRLPVSHASGVVRPTATALGERVGRVVEEVAVAIFSELMNIQNSG